MTVNDKDLTNAVIPFTTVLDAFDFANVGGSFGCESYICKQTGASYFYSEYGDNEEELPDDIDDEKYLMLPDKQDLELGNRLVFEFSEEHMAELFQKIEAIFRRKGAYHQFKILLEQSGQLEHWYEFEKHKTEIALRQWCLEQGINITDSD